jgi:hypothetical protein
VLKEAPLIIKPCLPDLRDIFYLKKPNIPTLSPIAEGYTQGLDERIDHRSWRASDFTTKGGKIYRQNTKQYCHGQRHPRCSAPLPILSEKENTLVLYFRTRSLGSCIEHAHYYKVQS